DYYCQVRDGSSDHNYIF
nr:immunoglobulin light chain junction region [Macaca mulatta]MOW36403.1 immunoglobulin light chain junction region [Macaca mulatta]MOW36485.1 immunoglobulin light chain junction region [Macaca mulatta]MOW36829.1 immunoglobulin light chain junction region [Macaca mulatta]MOW36930.1 immunoglobulin light chain junction region [Macaca mulatta]